MKQSIKIKLMRWIIPAVAISLILSVAITTKIVSDNDKELAVNNAKETAAKYSNDLNSQLVASLSSTNNFANNLSVYSSQNRTEVSLMVKSFVENNTQFLSSSLCYEPNAFDGNDKKYANQAYHDGSGRMIPYWIRGAGGITFDKLTGFDDAGSDWYTVPKQTKQSYITQPLLYNGSLIVSFCSPIMKNGAFAGAAYGDMPLNFLDGVISKITLLKSGYAILLSKQGVILSAKDKSLIGVKSVKDLSDNGKNDLMTKLAASIEKGNDDEFSSVDKETGNDVFVATAKVKTSGWFMVVIVPENEMLAGAHAVRNWLAVIGIAIILLIAGAIYYITSKLTKPITDAQKLISELSKGHLGYKVQNKSSDEIGDIINDLEVFSQKLKTDFIDVVTDVANGNLDNEVRLIDERDEITPALLKTVNSLKGVMAEAKSLIDAAVAGNLHHRADDKKFSGVYNEIVSGMNKMLDTVAKPIDEGYNTLAVLASGDLTARMSEEYDGDYHRIAESINSLADSFQNALNEVGGAIEATSSAANQISSSTEQMAAGVQESSMQTTEIASAVEEMTQTIYESAQNATNAAENSRLARDKATNGKSKVEETKQGMQKIVEATQVTGKIISSLSHRTDQIGQITQVIDEIADQTNLLALNAAIEAARAGEQGRGFAVVADEVRKLAERTTKATKEIANTIKTVQTEAKEADQSMEMADSSVKYGMELTEQVSLVLNEILDANQNVSELVSQLAASTEQQSATAEEISKNIDSISTVTNEAAHGTTQIAQAANDLSRLTERLQASISKFKLSRNSEMYGNQYNKKQRRFIETP